MSVAKAENGWEPIHEAVRGGKVDAVQVLVDKGAVINQRTMHGKGNQHWNSLLKNMAMIIS